MLTKETLERNLKKSLEELEKCRPATTSQRRKLEERKSKPEPACENVAWNLPLSHSTTLSAFKAITSSRRLKSQAELGRRDCPIGESTEARLDTADSVFFYVGSFGYPNTSCGFLFNPGIEHTLSGVAHPFDSGAIDKLFLKDHSLEAKQRYLHAYSLPLPKYRKLVRRTLELLFLHPIDYLTHVGPDVGCSHLPTPGDRRRWTFEVRFMGGVPAASSLSAFFIPAGVVGQEWFKPIYKWAKESGIAITYIKSPSTNFNALAGACRDFIVNQLDP